MLLSRRVLLPSLHVRNLGPRLVTFGDGVLELLLRPGAPLLQAVALVADGTLFLKVDDDNREAFEKAGTGPFIFRSKDGKESSMSYYQCPDEAFDRSETMKPWINLALDAAKRQEVKKNSKKK